MLYVEQIGGQPNRINLAGTMIAHLFRLNAHSR